LLINAVAVLRRSCRLPCPFSQMRDLEGSIMSYSGSGNSSGWSQGGNQAGGPNYRHAFDPYLEPELFRSVLTRRVIAFIIDLFILAVPIALAVIFIAISRSIIRIPMVAECGPPSEAP